MSGIWALQMLVIYNIGAPTYQLQFQRLLVDMSFRNLVILIPGMCWLTNLNLKENLFISDFLIIQTSRQPTYLNVPV